EKIMTLDEVERELDPEMLIIADGAGPVAVAGVMGGFDSEITAKTTRILIESAHFDGASIRRTSRKLGLRSESSLRFERGVNLEGAARAADRAAQLMAELAGGKVAKGRIDCYVRPYRPVTIELRPERVNYLLGTEIAPEKMKELLERLQLEVKVKAPSQAGNEYGDSQSARGDSAAHRSSTPIFSVTIPAYRGDLTQEVDLVEEIARLYGYNRIPVSLPGNITARVKQTPAQRREEAGREAAAASGLAEVITYSFIGPRALDQLQLAADHPWRQTVKIHNPLREEQSLMRPSLLPGLLEVAARNAGRRVMPVAIYELGRVFAPSGELLPHEMLRLGGLVMGSSSRGWSWPAEEMDFFYLKGVLANILDLLQLKDISWEATGEYPFLHPGRAATVKAGETLLGFLGELHPDVQDAVSLPARACVFELDWDVVAGLMQPKSAYQPLPRYPAVERDLAVVVEAETPAAAVSAVIKEAAGEMLTSLTLFDVYQGDPVPAGYKSLAYSLVYQLADRTLTDAEVNASLEQVQKALQQKLAATLRQQ
ncbi:MAG: phenylalanine--tRNA ligase subunit beta, partial [Clostridia bacterium]|nr:phenylalanine--tRNA ligase subunit beta [Clostridia bacterium]